MKHTLCLLAATLLSLTGCVPSHDVSGDEMNRWWTLTAAEAMIERQGEKPDASARELGIPQHWTIRYDDSVIRSTVTLVRAMDAIDAGANDVTFSLAPEHIQPLLDILADTRATMRDLENMLGVSGKLNQTGWAQTLAEGLVTVEQISREATGEATGADEPLGMAGEPLIDLLAPLISGGSGGEDILEELDIEEIGRLRHSLVRMLVRMGFDVAGRQATPQLTSDVARKLQAAEDLTKVQAELANWLAEELSEASPTVTGNRQAVAAALRYGPKGILMFERFLSQWSKMDSISVDLADVGGSQAVVLTIRVKDGQEVRIDRIMTGVPVIVFRGDSKISILTSGTPAGDAVVTFDPVGEGAVELRFEGLVYSLVRLLAFPLDSGPLREIRVATSRPMRGEQLVNVAVLMESSRDPNDPRRMLSVQNVRRQRVIREVLDIRTVTERSETTVSYITPDRRYTYERIKDAEE